MSTIPKSIPDVGIQILWMKKFFPNFRYFKENGKKYWIGTLEPTETSPVYRLKIRFYLDKSPRVEVLEPSLDPKAPHRYPDGSLCLYSPADPKDQKWTQDGIIAKTIVPWAAAWLYFYEYWQETGVWYNEEASHQGPKELD